MRHGVKPLSCYFCLVRHEHRLDGLESNGTSEAWRGQDQARGCRWQDTGDRLRPKCTTRAVRQTMRLIPGAAHHLLYAPPALCPRHSRNAVL